MTSKQAEDRAREIVLKWSHEAHVAEFLTRSCGELLVKTISSVITEAHAAGRREALIELTQPLTGQAEGFTKAALDEAYELGRREALAELMSSDEEVRDYFQWSKDTHVSPLQALEVVEWMRARALKEKLK